MKRKPTFTIAGLLFVAVFAVGLVIHDYFSSREGAEKLAVVASQPGTGTEAPASATQGETPDVPAKPASRGTAPAAPEGDAPAATTPAGRGPIDASPLMASGGATARVLTAAMDSIDIFIALAADGGSDSNDGLSARTPKLTFAAAQNVASAGQTIGYLPGKYTDESQYPRYTKKLNGAGGQRITIRPASAFGSVIFDNRGRNGAMGWISGQGAIIEGFEFRHSDSDGPLGGLGPPNGCKGIYIDGHYHTVRYCYLHDIVGNYQGNAGTMRLQDCTFCTIHNNAFADLRSASNGSSTNVSHIILFSGGGNTIHSNYFELSNGKNEAFIRQKHEAKAPGLNRCYNNCLVARNGEYSGIDMASLIANTGWQIDHNLCIGAHIGAATNTRGSYNTIEYNTIYKSASLIHVLHGGVRNTIRRNILYAFGVYHANGNRTWRYNHYSDDAAYNEAVANDVWDHNCYFNPDQAHDGSYFGDKASGAAGGIWTLAQFQAVGQDLNSVVRDPLFVNIAGNDFRLQKGSLDTDKGCYQPGYDPPMSVSAATGW